MRQRRRRRTADIDITPLIDVLFMLIIFFVLTASFIQGHIEVALPTGGGDPPGEGAVTLVVEKNGRVLWDGREITRGDIARLARETSGREIMIAADREASYGDVAEILEILRKEGVGTAGLLTEGGND